MGISLKCADVYCTCVYCILQDISTRLKQHITKKGWLYKGPDSSRQESSIISFTRVSVSACWLGVVGWGGVEEGEGCGGGVGMGLH